VTIFYCHPEFISGSGFYNFNKDPETSSG
jgi:hypothetical protein